MCLQLCTNVVFFIWSVGSLRTYGYFKFYMHFSIQGRLVAYLQEKWELPITNFSADDEHNASCLVPFSPDHHACLTDLRLLPVINCTIIATLCISETTS